MKKKQEEITFEEFANQVSTNPQKYMGDTIRLAAKLQTYKALYGDLGYEGLMEFLKGMEETID